MALSRWGLPASKVGRRQQGKPLCGSTASLLRVLPLPPFHQLLNERKTLGEKTGSGFYK